MSIKYFSEMLRADEHRDALLTYAGMILAFDDIFGSYGVGNQMQAKDYKPDEPQYISAVIYSETDPLPDTGYFIDVYPTGDVIVNHIFSVEDPDYDGERCTVSEQYESTITDIIKWLRSQPPKLHSFLTLA